MPDQLRPLLIRVGGQPVHERLGAGARDGAKRLTHLGGGHPDAIVLDREAPLIGVEDDVDARLWIVAQQRRRGDAFVAQLFAGVGRVGDEFAQEDVPV